MKKIVKWFLRVLLILLGLIIILLIVIPKFYKDEILTKVKDEINNNVNAKVEFVDFKLSMFKTFPDLNIGLHELSVTGINQFEGDTLVYFKSFNVQVNLMSAIKKNVVVKGIILNEPFINGKVLADSSVNWDIAKPVEEVIDTIQVEEEVAVEDSVSETMDYRVDLQKFQIKDAKIKYTDETSDMSASLDNLNFLLKGNFGADYSDLTIKTSIDAINVKMGAIKYLKNTSFGFDATIGADLENMIFTFEENLFSLNDIALGFDGVVKMMDEDIDFDVTFNTKKTSFKSLLSMVPAIYMEGFEELKTTGNLVLSGDIKGTYSETQMPLANIKLLVENARIQYPDLPKAVENINIDFSVFYDGVVNDNTKVDLNKFHLEMANNPFDLSMHLKTPFSDPYIEASFDGHIILNTLADALPLEDMSLNGEITADVDIAGSMSTIENENYEDFNATGKLQLKDFIYESPDLPAAVKIIEATFNFTPQFLELKSFDSEIGESDFHLNGKIENYIPYALSDGTLRGDFKFTSSYINANEFMTETEEAEVAEEETVDSTSVTTVFEVPDKIDFKLASSLDHILYDKMDIKNLTGTFLIKDKKVLMDNLNMKILDGEIGIDGEYNTQKIEEPTVIMGLDIRNIEIESAVNSFSMIEKMAPILKDCKGKVSIKFDFESLLDSEMSPVLSTIDGYGRLKSDKIEVISSKTLDQLGEVLKMADKFDNEFKDINISFKIKDGRITVEPFDVKVSEINMNVAGSHGIDQTLDYNLNLLVPRKYFGLAANEALDGLLKEAAAKGVNLDVSENIKVKAKVVGTSTDPKITLNYKDDSGDAEKGLKEELKKKADAEARKEIEARAQKVIDDAEKEAAKIKKEAREAADKIITDGNKEADALVAKAAKEGYLAKVAAETAAKEAKKEAKKQADALVNKADKKADGIVEAARVEADKIKKEK
ncbi:MAG: AsmA family protein [Bacteroidales bacterium]|nr:AsmA family protein [Bacteroidales bacterium]